MDLLEAVLQLNSNIFLEYDRLTYWKLGEVEKILSLLDKLLVATISTNKANRQT